MSIDFISVTEEIDRYLSWKVILAGFNGIRHTFRELAENEGMSRWNDPIA